MASGDKPTPGNILEFAEGEKDSAQLDHVARRYWWLINDMFEITCYLWSKPCVISCLYDCYKGFLVYGSHCEGTATGFYDRTTWRGRTPLEDTDIMIVYSHLQGLPSFELSHRDCHAGFARVICNDPISRFLVLDDGRKLDFSNVSPSLKGVATYSTNTFIDYVEDTMKLFPSLGGLMSSGQSGPASTVLMTQRSDGISNLSFDTILAIEGPSSWLVEAEEWRTRHRVSGWPSPALVEEATSQGYLLVPTPHPSSDAPQDEWRISFSQAENTLFQNIGRWQKNCFMIVKLLCKKAFSGWKLLSTYHVKTMFLWLLEEYPATAWSRRTIGQMALLLLDNIILAFAKKNLPSYFIPSNNLIDHFSRDHTKSCVHILQNLRKKPLTYIAQFVQAVVGKKVLQIQESAKDRGPYIDVEDAKASLQQWCVIIATGQQQQGGVEADFPTGSLTYKALIEIILKMSEFSGADPGSKRLELEGLMRHQNTEIEPESYQGELYPDSASIYCALASHYRVQYHKNRHPPHKAVLFEKTRALFESSVQYCSQLHDYIVAEYAAFLLDAGLLGEACEMLGRQHDEKVVEYNHYMGDEGFVKVPSRYFLLWLRLKVALMQGRFTSPIIVEYEAMFAEDERRSRLLDEAMPDQFVDDFLVGVPEAVKQIILTVEALEKDQRPQVCSPPGPMKDLFRRVDTLLDKYKADDTVRLLKLMKAMGGGSGDKEKEELADIDLD